MATNTLPTATRKITSSAALVLLASLFAPSGASADNAIVEATYGSWTVFKATNPMNDKSWYGAETPSNTGSDRLHVDCESYSPNELHVGFRLNKYIGRDFGEVIYRVDSRPAHYITGSVSTNGTSVSLLCEGTCKGDGKSRPEVAFISEARNGSQLLLQVQNWQYENIDVSFKLDGASQAFDYLIAGCKRLATEIHAKKS